ncbi:GNAT family N-acetyltransferase [Naumannella halotolerans]|uniref:GNAT family N-acetyltransferase n=1 Tax=Naumannella halotolerans TaxID=993414 RepID=UPI00370D5678
MSRTVTLPIRTERLLLRAYRPDDVADSLAYYSDPEVARYLLDDPWTLELATQRVNERVERVGIEPPSAGLALVVERDGVMIGDLALWATDGSRSKGEVGWVFARSAAGKGYATEAVNALFDIAFGTFGMHRVAAQLDPRNEPSARLCERLGMKHEAHLRQDWYIKGEWTDTGIYGLLATDPRPGRSV